jgi:hypothetical protein
MRGHDGGRPVLVVLVISVAVILIAGGLAVAKIPDANGTISACYAKKTGAVRIIDREKGQRCHTGEVALKWNVRGPAGARGITGPEGPVGPTGPKGEPAEPVEHLEDLDGLSCRAGTPFEGTVEVRYDGADVLLRCVPPGPQSIAELRAPDTRPEPGSVVVVQGAVSAVHRSQPQFWMQDVPTAPFGGIVVRLPLGSALPSTGDVVRVTGQLAVYYGEDQIGTVSQLETVSATEVVPLNVAAGEAGAPENQSLLLQVQGVTVFDVAPTYGEFRVTGSLIVDDDLFPYSLPNVGEAFTSLTGVLTFKYSAWRLLPRTSEDMVAAQPE